MFVSFNPSWHPSPAFPLTFVFLTAELVPKREWGPGLLAMIWVGMHPSLMQEFKSFHSPARGSEQRSKISLRAPSA